MVQSFINMFIVLFFCFSVSLTQCPIYSCNDASLTSGICSVKKTEGDQTTFQLQRCNHEMICNTNAIDPNNQSYCYFSSEMRNLYPGETCIYNHQCLSDKCENHICQGKGYLEKCVSDDQCNPEYYCYKNICEKFLTLNNTLKCDIQPNTYLCDPNLACAYGTCVELGSLGYGKISQEDFGCISGYTYLDISSFKHTCSPGSILENSSGDPIECPENNKCLYKGIYNGSEYEYSTVCKCGFRSSSNQLCPLGKGELLTEIKTVIDYINKYKPKCHKNKKWFCNTFPYPEDYFKAFASYQKIFNSEDLVQNDVCSKEIFTFDYWNSLENVDSMDKYKNYNLPQEGFSSFLFTT